jgi:hypothetical protein
MSITFQSFRMCVCVCVCVCMCEQLLKRDLPLTNVDIQNNELLGIGTIINKFITTYSPGITETLYPLHNCPLYGH